MFLDVLRTIALVLYDLIAFVGVRWAAFITDKMVGDNLIYCAPGKMRDEPLFETPVARQVAIAAVAVIQWGMSAVAFVTATEGAVGLALLAWVFVPVVTQIATIALLFCVVTFLVWTETVAHAIMRRWKQVRGTAQ